MASEFFAREPQRRAWEAMRRDHAEYEQLLQADDGGSKKTQ